MPQGHARGPRPYGTNSTEQYARSIELTERAVEAIPGGSSSHSRIAAKFEPNPTLFFESGEGATVRDADGNEYIDYNCGHSAIIRGHATDETEATAGALGRGLTFGAPNEAEVGAAELVNELVPSADYTKFATSGTHAASAAVRLARAYTGRETILKFEGMYHGHSDGLSFNGAPEIGDPGTRKRPYTLPMAPGIPDAAAEPVEVLPWNDAGLVAETLERRGGEIAAVITEPVWGNGGLAWPREGYLGELRALTREHGALLIFDEVITGFRLAPGGAQERFGVEPDLTVLGKALGNGLPVSALAGRSEVMELYNRGASFAGTYAGGPAIMAGTRANLEALAELGSGAYRDLLALGDRLAEGVHEIAADAGYEVLAQPFAGFLYTNFLREEVGEIREWRDVNRHVDRETAAAFAREMIGEGSFLSPSYSRVALTFAHTREHVDRTLEHAKAAIERVE